MIGAVQYQQACDQFCGLDPCEKTRWKDFTVLTRSYYHVSDGEEEPPFVSMIC